MVGKKTDQVGRGIAAGELVSNDEATFDKLNQAVNSCQDLLRALPGGSPRRVQRVILPVLVLPPGALWQVDYSPDGSITKQPRQVNRATFFLDHTWTVPGIMGSQLSYRLSHIELVTFEALAGIAESWFGAGGFFPS
ncbi:MAG: hypothetical protein ABSF98_19950 [Bryobacteraceae bacterium]|jgi:hypothetical protein